jgi:hypothetical protein
MGISETTAEFMTAREGDHRVWRTGWLGRRRYVIRDEADRRALVSYARGTGLLTLAVVVSNPFIIRLLKGGELPLILGFFLMLIPFTVIYLSLRRRLIRSLGQALDS